MALTIPATLASNCRKTPARLEWLDRLPAALRALAERWSLRLGPPFEGEDVTCAWVAPVALGNGTTAVLKIGMPHMEAEHEAEGLRFWNGDPTVRLLQSDDDTGAMLLERCTPGITLRELPEPQQDEVISRLLLRLWRSPADPHPFRHLSTLLESWSAETLAASERWSDAALIREGLVLFQELPRSAKTDVLLATDLHAGNVLRSGREPWLVIDPKPFVGDPAYDATQHLFNCDTRLRTDPDGTIARIADLLGLDAERIRLWAFARAAAEPRDDWRNDHLFSIARAIAP